MKDKFKTVPLDTMIDKQIGKEGTTKRDAFERELRIDLLGEAILTSFLLTNISKIKPPG